MRRKNNPTSTTLEQGIPEAAEFQMVEALCHEWNPLFGISGAVAGISCKLPQEHEGEHEVVITLGNNPQIQNRVYWASV